jgi:hypothetical protein
VVLSQALSEAINKQSKGINCYLGVGQANRFCGQVNSCQLKQSHGMVGHNEGCWHLCEATTSFGDCFEGFGSAFVHLWLRGICCWHGVVRAHEPIP